MRKEILITAIVLLGLSVKAQDVSLSNCVEKAKINNPFAGNRELANQLATVRKNIVKKAWLPGIEMNAQATWQSDVVAFTLDLPFPVDFPSMPRDQYKATLDISQLIYDGGSIKAQQLLEDINARITRQEVDVKELGIVETVEDLFFAVLNLNRKLEIIELMSESLKSTLSQIRSGISNGILTEADFEILSAELIRLDQQKIQLSSLKRKAIQTLTVLTGIPMSDKPLFIVPPDPVYQVSDLSRPELPLFALQTDLIDARIKLLSGQLRPRIAAFGQEGYGKPGLNFLGNSWDPYMIVGMRFSWTLLDWGKTKGQKEALSLSKKFIDNQVNAFSQQLSIAGQAQLKNIEEISSLLVRDRELTETRAHITAAYQSKLTNGLITGSTFLTEWTREQEALINLEARKIELLSAKYKYLTINGKTQ